MDMKIVEKTGKTIEEAKALAKEELGAQDESLLGIEVLEEGARGILGIGGKSVRIKAWIKEDIRGIAEQFVRDVFALAELEAEVKWELIDDQNRINVTGPNLGSMIGKYGQTLDCLQYILNIAISKKVNEKTRIVLDVGGYRARRERHLQDLAYSMAEKAKEEKRNITLDPMSASERRIIHIALKDHPLVETYSSGEEPMRKVVITPKRKV